MRNGIKKKKAINLKSQSVKTAAKFIKDAIKNYAHETNTYHSVDEILCTEKSHVPELPKVFMDELVKPLKQISIAQALFAATRPRSVMALQFGLAVSTDNDFSSKWLNTLLSKWGLLQVMTR